MKSGPKKILILSLEGVGNALLALPMARALSQDGFTVSFLTGNKSAAELLDSQPHLCCAHWTGEFDSRKSLIRFLKKESYSIAVMAYPTLYKASWIAWSAGIKTRIGVKTPQRSTGPLTVKIPHTDGLHDVERNMEIARALAPGAVLDMQTQFIRPSESEIAQAGRFLADNNVPEDAVLIGLHPGSDGNFVYKRYPEDLCAKFADIIHKDKGWVTLVFEGPNEPGMAMRIARRSKSPVVVFDRRERLAFTAALMMRTAAVVAGDAGLMNLSWACGRPTLALFGPTDPARTRPLGQGNRYLLSPRCCAPCYKLGVRPTCIETNNACMTDIEPSQAASALYGMLSGEEASHAS